VESASSTIHLREAHRAATRAASAALEEGAFTHALVTRTTWLCAAACRLHGRVLRQSRIGIPTLVSNFIPPHITVQLQSRERHMWMGAPSPGGEEDPTINAGKQTVTNCPTPSFSTRANRRDDPRRPYRPGRSWRDAGCPRTGDLANWMITLAWNGQGHVWREDLVAGSPARRRPDEQTPPAARRSCCAAATPFRLPAPRWSRGDPPISRFFSRSTEKGGDGADRNAPPTWSGRRRQGRQQRPNFRVRPGWGRPTPRAPSPCHSCEGRNPRWRSVGRRPRRVPAFN